MNLDRLALTLLLREFAASVRGLRWRDRAWIVLGGGGLVAYAVGIFVVGIRARADGLRDLHWLWLAAVPAGCFGLGLSEAATLARLATARAHAPFTRALPIADSARRRTTAVATLVLGLPGAAMTVVAVAGSAALVGRSPLLAGLLAALAQAGGTAAGIAVVLRRPWIGPAETARGAESARRALPGRVLAGLDRRRPAWIGTWARNGAAVRPSRFAAPAALLVAVGVGAVVMSLVRGSAGPAVAVAVVGGTAVFMATLRCHPLVSPVLRASALGFGRAVAGLVRLPLAPAAAFFAALAVPAFAAEPAAWEVPVGGGIGFVALAAIYTVFAAFFATAPLVARFAFVAALALAWYESLEYGRTVLIGLAALLIFLWHRARRAYLHG